MYLEGRGEVELCLEPLLWEVCSTDLQGGEHRGEMVVTCTRRYSPLRGLTSSSCGGLRPRLFLPFGQKRAYYAVLAHFWQFLVSSSNLGNF